jgi:hypothetical protein
MNEADAEKDGAVPSGERALVPLAAVPAAHASVPDGPGELARLLAAAALGLALETQRRSLGAAAAVAARARPPLGLLARPALAVARGSVAVARHHLDLDGWAARGLAGQRRAQEAAARAVQALIATVVAAVLDEVDLDQVVARVDLNAIIDRVDIDAIAARIDLDAIAARLDVDAVAARLDIHAILARIDLPELTEQVIDEVDLGEIIRESSSTMATETVDALRVQGMRVDGLVSRVVDRILLREEPRQTGPPRQEPRP